MKNLFRKQLSGDKISKSVTSEILLWPDGAPGSEGMAGREETKIVGGEKIISSVHRPSITAYLPAADLATGAGVIIAPGGGHKELWIDHEGHSTARLLCGYGIAAFVLKYRLAKQAGSPYTIHGHALADMQRAIRLVRANAEAWKINTSSIGVMGFSAGGEIAALSAMYFDEGDRSCRDIILQQSAYPNFQALIYPEGTSNFKASKYSPSIFLLCGDNDDDEITKGVVEMYLMYKQEGIPAELHVYAKEGHGFGVRKNNHFAIAKWPERFVDWLSRTDFIKK
jgi:acetyl esterase/lipase